jgi:hypothetical protein
MFSSKCMSEDINGDVSPEGLPGVAPASPEVAPPSDLV